jgi:hypothetical protein
MSTVKDRANRDAKGCFAVIAKVPLFFLGWVIVGRLTIRADGTIRPACRFQMLYAAFLCWELLENLYNIQGFLPAVKTICSLDKNHTAQRWGESQHLKLGNSVSLYTNK